ncbi:aromatic ring-hydroxylating oxygenase subunit alpha [Stenoxybacter acetivorans]|uniref:aromatic ring-hydroxylating dioxygenase subunit alpha n=1 Tax=Stenoxybacter acetivorans TaxID=422441 RepID=UPI00055FE3F8|nr:aromatic ring-hydroxylating dioxygenase subunit alpha [Stenoxybacter acetivorans]
MLYTGKWERESIDYKALKNQWHVVLKSQDLIIGKPKAIRLLGEELVLWRDGSGTIHAWKDYCGHRGAKLSNGCIKNDEIECPYHGWRFNSAGECTLVPAHPNQTPPSSKNLIFSHYAKECYGFIWVALDKPDRSIPLFSEWENSNFRKIYAGPYFYKSNALRAVENFLDASHFPFVHANLNGDPNFPDILDNYQVFKNERGLKTSEISVYQPYGDHRGIPVTARYTYSVLNPTTAYFNKQTGETERFCTFLNATPVDEDECIIWLIVAINFGEYLSEEKILYRQDLVFEQDRLIVESQRPIRLPLDIKQEMHVKSDKLSIEYRYWIKELGTIKS